MELNLVDQYLNTLDGNNKEWAEIFVSYMRSHYPDLEEVISFQMPTYKLGNKDKRNYIAFGYGKNHFSMHSLDFEYITLLKQKLIKPGKGKGCVQVSFDNKEEIPILKQAIDDIYQRYQNDKKD